MRRSVLSLPKSFTVAVLLLIAPAALAQPDAARTVSAPVPDSSDASPSSTPSSVVLVPGAVVERLPPGAVDAAPPCRYEVCALRLDTGFMPQIVQGRQERTVLRLGLATPRLAALVADSPAAVRHAREFERTHLPLQVVSTGSLALSALSILPGVPTRTRIVSTIGGVLLGFAARPLGADNRRALERALWEYNATLAR